MHADDLRFPRLRQCQRQSCAIGPAAIAQAQRRAVECGVPDAAPFMHPTLLKNKGNWKYHDRPRPGVLHHVSHSGDQVWSVRAGTQRQMDTYTIRTLCDIADKFGEGFVRFTIRSNIEYILADQKKVDPLIAAFRRSVCWRMSSTAFSTSST